MNIGIDLGGSHVGVGLVDENGKILIKKEKDLNQEDKVQIEETIESLIQTYITEILEEKRIINGSYWNNWSCKPWKYQTKSYLSCCQFRN